MFYYLEKMIIDMGNYHSHMIGDVTKFMPLLVHSVCLREGINPYDTQSTFFGLHDVAVVVYPCGHLAMALFPESSHWLFPIEFMQFLRA